MGNTVYKTVVVAGTGFRCKAVGIDAGLVPVSVGFTVLYQVIGRP